MFRTFRRFVEAIEHIAGHLQALVVAQLEIVRAQQELGPATDRLNRLELERHQFEAQIEGLLLRAEGKLKAANNAEARERQLKKSYERLVDPFPEDGQPESPEGVAVLSDDAQTGEAQRLHAMRLDVAPVNSKTLAQRAKFGVR